MKEEMGVRANAVRLYTIQINSKWKCEYEVRIKEKKNYVDVDHDYEKKTNDDGSGGMNECMGNF